MMFAPAAWQFIKIPLVIISVALLLLHYIRNIKKVMNVTVIVWFAILLSYGIIWSFIGAIKGNPGLTDAFRLNVMWVVLYALYVFYIDSIEKFNSLVNTMVWATLAIAIYNIAILLSAFDIIPNVNIILNIDDDLTSDIGIHAGFIQMVSNNIGSLTFLTPFLLTLYAMNCRSFFGLSKIILLLSVILSIIAALISGRRALWIELLATPFLILAVNHYNSEINSIKTTKSILKYCLVTPALLLTVSVGMLTYYFDWNVSLLIDRFINAFESGVRHDQMYALLKGFTDSPIFGTGFGVGVIDVVRSDERPWTYELTYVLMLYNTGILGTAFYVICIGIIYYCYMKFIRYGSPDKAITSSLLVALTCFLIANATNPYFGTYDYMWMLYLPVAYINATQSDMHRQITLGDVRPKVGSI